MLVAGRKFFFVQAEDGIRDLVRSRGLGDVYKRQDPFYKALFSAWGDGSGMKKVIVSGGAEYWYGAPPVSYTHLTLPTSALV